MKKALPILAAMLGPPAAWSLIRRRNEDRETSAAWRRLAASRRPASVFDPATVDGLPEPAARFLRFAIAPGVQLRTIAEIDMRGEIALGAKEAPQWRAMRARQILAAPEGFVWRARVGRPPLPIVGSDGLEGGRSWVRFRLLDLIPVVRDGGGVDHLRAAFGRAAAEAAFWTPAALSPQSGVTWAAVDANRARATMRRGPLSQTVDVHVDAEGRPIEVTIARWTNANPDREYRLQPFGGLLSDFREVEGHRVPFRVEGGNFFGTADYFPFYRVEVEAIRFHPAADAD